MRKNLPLFVDVMSLYLKDPKISTRKKFRSYGRVKQNDRKKKNLCSNKKFLLEKEAKKKIPFIKSLKY